MRGELGIFRIALLVSPPCLKPRLWLTAIVYLPSFFHASVTLLVAEETHESLAAPNGYPHAGLAISRGESLLFSAGLALIAPMRMGPISCSVPKSCRCLLATSVEVASLSLSWISTPSFGRARTFHLLVLSHWPSQILIASLRGAALLQIMDKEAPSSLLSSSSLRSDIILCDPAHIATLVYVLSVLP